MRMILLGMALLATVGAVPGVARAGRFGWQGPGCGGGQAVIVPTYPPYWSWPPALAYGPYYYPYYGYYGPSYFRPDLPPGSNLQRNWRDTWQDDGVKVHGYTWH